MSFSQINSLPGAIGPAATTAFQTGFNAQPESFAFNGGAQPMFGSFDSAQSQYPPQSIQPAGAGGTYLANGYLNGNYGTTGNNGNTAGGLLGAMQNMISGLMNELQQLFGSLGGGSDQVSPQNAMGDVTLSSTGDPHLAMTGTDAQGNALSQRFDSMTGHNDLIDSDSFNGGYQVSTSVTSPGANGVTYNQSATVTANNGNDTISLDKNGNATIASDGQQYSLSAGQSITLDGGETVTKNQDGSLSIADDNGQGGTLTTKLSLNGQGVDVNATGHNVDVGGAIANHGKHGPHGPHHNRHPEHGTGLKLPDGDGDGDDQGYGVNQPLAQNYGYAGGNGYGDIVTPLFPQGVQGVDMDKVSFPQTA